MFVLGAGCGNFGFGPCTRAGVMGNGDTLNINGDSDINPGSQAQYPIGYDATGVITPSNSGNCTAGGSLNCTMGNPPAGTSASAMTTIQTTPGSTHQAQLWGREKINQVLEADNNFVLINNLEITQHSACIYGSPASGSIGGFPRSCNTGSSPFGNYGIDGVFYGGTSSEMENMNIHGMAHNGTQSDNLTNFISLNNKIYGNAFNGDGPGDLYSGSTVSFNSITWQNDIIVYNGCGSVYPPHSSDPYDTANYHDCWDQANAGQGDGLGSQAGTTLCTGNFDFINDDISFNTQDGIDFLHCNAQGTMHVYRSRMEGNEGQQIKINVQNAYVENSEIIGTCYYHNGSNPIDFNNGNFNNCRAGGDAIAIIMNGGTYTIENSTVLATAPGIEDVGNSAPCAGTLTWYNDNVIGGYETPVYGNNQTATWFDYECSSGSVTTLEDYNHVWNTNNQSQCAGAHDHCNDTGAGTTTTLTTSMIGPTNYYSGNDLGHLLYPAGGGQLIGNANNAIVLQGTSNDFNNFSRGTSWAIGSYQQSSTLANGGTCFANSECASGGCSSNVCSGSCTNLGGACASGASCCSGLCNASQCVISICGNNVVEGAEICDGSALSGQTCLTQGFAGGGTLSCNVGCGGYNTSGCSNTVNFPNTSVLDTFIRANSTGLGTSWTQASGQMNVSSNTALPIVVGSDKYYWSAATFNADQEVYVTIANKGTNGDSLKLYGRLNPTTGVAYKLNVDIVNGVTTLIAQTPSSSTLLTISQTTGSGDSWGMNLTGSVISVYYKASGGSWALKGTVTDSSITAGGNTELGSDTGTGTPNITFTNFGGGNLSGGCSAVGTSCSTGASCCSSLCSLSQCVSCVSNTNSCVLNSDCCSNLCSGGVCSAPTPPSNSVFNCSIGGQSKVSGTF